MENGISNFFVIITKFNVFVSITKAIALFVLIMVIMMILRVFVKV